MGEGSSSDTVRIERITDAAAKEFLGLLPPQHTQVTRIDVNMHDYSSNYIFERYIRMIEHGKVENNLENAIEIIDTFASRKFKDDRLVAVGEIEVSSREGNFSYHLKLDVGRHFKDPSYSLFNIPADIREYYKFVGEPSQKISIDFLVQDRYQDQNGILNEKSSSYPFPEWTCNDTIDDIYRELKAGETDPRNLAKMIRKLQQVQFVSKRDLETLSEIEDRPISFSSCKHRYFRQDVELSLMLKELVRDRIDINEKYYGLELHSAPEKEPSASSIYGFMKRSKVRTHVTIERTRNAMYQTLYFLLPINIPTAN